LQDRRRRIAGDICRPLTGGFEDRIVSFARRAKIELPGGASKP
jgi:hypothetical protein